MAGKGILVARVAFLEAQSCFQQRDEGGGREGEREFPGERYLAQHRELKQHLLRSQPRAWAPSPKVNS